MNGDASRPPSRETSARPWVVVAVLLLLLGAGVWGLLVLLTPERGTWRAIGVVQAVGEDFVVIRHEAIPGLRGAGSSTFFAATQALLDGVKPGDRVRLVLKASSSAEIVMRLEKRP